MSRQRGKTFYLKVEVSQNWIDDGFDMTEERCRQIAEELLPYAEGNEIVVKRIYRSSRGSLIAAGAVMVAKAAIAKAKGE